MAELAAELLRPPAQPPPRNDGLAWCSCSAARVTLRMTVGGLRFMSSPLLALYRDGLVLAEAVHLPLSSWPVSLRPRRFGSVSHIFSTTDRTQTVRKTVCCNFRVLVVNVR